MSSSIHPTSSLRLDSPRRKDESKSTSAIRSSSKGSVTENRGTSPNGSESARKRRNSKSNNLPRLNTWDVPEFLPGAQPGANPLQKAFFEERSKKVYKAEKLLNEFDAHTAEERSADVLARKLEEGILKLRELFPAIEVDVIQEAYLSNESNLDAAITELLHLSSDSVTLSTTTVVHEELIVTDDAVHFPPLQPAEDVAVTTDARAPTKYRRAASPQKSTNT